MRFHQTSPIWVYHQIPVKQQDIFMTAPTTLIFFLFGLDLGNAAQSFQSFIEFVFLDYVLFSLMWMMSL